MILRAAEPRDAGEISKIWNVYIRDTSVTFTTTWKTPDTISTVLKDKAQAKLPFFVAEDEGKVLGFVTYGPFRTGPGYVHTMEHSIMLSDAAKGRGTGRALMQAIEEEACRKNVHTLVAGISAENPNAIAFHQAIGFKKVGHVAQAGRKFGRWMDLILLQKMLDCRTDKPDQSL
ncbi:N-acyltransferase YncA [Roseovarius albus]|uniref:N-acyltransferase YncA n=1 Tax=Roseovarius albus TaxID=1247867 RepID=A0A1X6ZJU3_9RHOB|nr:GNAT family N-acetyltransferase [Roseovarius albus]SLN51551.1 N-acyltransferase YncA [Roseovarius albus]